MSDSFMTPWTVVYQAPLSTGFSRREYQSGLPWWSSRGSSQPRDWTNVSYTGRQILYHWAPREAPQLLYPINKQFLPLPFSNTNFWLTLLHPNCHLLAGTSPFPSKWFLGIYLSLHWSLQRASLTQYLVFSVLVACLSHFSHYSQCDIKAHPLLPQSYLKTLS